MSMLRLISSFKRHRSVGFLLFTLLTAMPSFASSTGGSLPWDNPLTTVKNSLTGPVALAVSVCALFACGAVLVFGGEMTEFVKRALYVVMAIAFIVGGASFVTTVFGFSGATISMIEVHSWAGQVSVVLDAARVG